MRDKSEQKTYIHISECAFSGKMNTERYKKFVDMLVEKHEASWAAVILDNGDIPAYRAHDEKNSERFLRSTRSFFWTMMSMGDMVDMPDLDGKYLEVIWNQKYFYNFLYMFRLENEIVMLATNKRMEEFMIELVSDMDAEMAPQIPGLIGFGIGDYDGNPISTYIDMDAMLEMGDGKEYGEDEVKRIFEDATKMTFEKFLYMGKAGFGEGKYMEIEWEKVSGWMFPYKDMVAAAMFTTGKVDTMINVLSYLLENMPDGD